MIPTILDTDEIRSLISAHESTHVSALAPAHDSVLLAATDLLVKNIKSNPSLFWKTFNAARGHQSSPLPRKLLNHQNVFVHDKAQVFSQWIAAFRRPTLDFRLYPELRPWWDFVDTSVAQWLRQLDSCEWGDTPILRTELITVLHKMKKRGAPGLDLITIKLILAVGDPIIDLLLIFFNKMWECECIPDQFLTDVIVPIFKKSCIWRALNYRPISLLQVCAKVFLAILYNRVEEFFSTHSFAGPYQFGGCKRRDRFQLLWLIDALSCNEAITHENGGSIFILAQDVGNAFPTVWIQLAAWYLRLRGVRGKIWRLIISMEMNTSSTLRINGHFSNTFKQGRGTAQGSPAAGHLFNTIQHLSIDLTNCAMTGVTAGKGSLSVKSLGFVDDVNTLEGANGAVTLQHWFDTRDHHAHRLRFHWKPEKDQVIIRGHLADTTFTFRRPRLPPLSSNDEMEILGVWITKTVGSSPKFLDRVLDEVKARTRGLIWLATVNSLPSTHILTHILDSLVTSLTTSKLVLVRLQDDDKHRIDLAKAELARTVLGVHPHTSRWALFHELNWPSMYALLIRAKLLFLGRLLRSSAEDNPVVAQMVNIRLDQVSQGDRSGFFGEVRIILRSVPSYRNPDELWESARYLSKGQWKKRVDGFIDLLNVELFNEWLDLDGHQQQWLRPTAYDNAVEDYTSLPLNRRTLVASARLSVTRAGADIPGSPSALCRCCYLGVPETIQHLTLDCPTAPSKSPVVSCGARK